MNGRIRLGLQLKAECGSSTGAADPIFATLPLGGVAALADQTEERPPCWRGQLRRRERSCST